MRKHAPTAVLSCLSPRDRVRTFDDRPHVAAYFHDVEAPHAHLKTPDARIAGAIIDFARLCGPRGCLLVHCKAGLSRSPAAGLVAAWAIAGEPEKRIAELATLAPWARPNRLLLAFGAAFLGHDIDWLLAMIDDAFGPQTRTSFGAVGPPGATVIWDMPNAC